MTAASNQMVMSPRRRKDSSYSAQFLTLYLVLYWVFTLLCLRAAICVCAPGAWALIEIDPPLLIEIDPLSV